MNPVGTMDRDAVVDGQHFETLLLELSTRFISVAPDHVRRPGRPRLLRDAV
jgi:hypothetical protein